MAISNELKEIYNNANYDIRLINTIEISHPSFSKIWYLAQDSFDFDGMLEDLSIVTYESYGFSFQQPNTTTKGQSNAKFVIDATDEVVLNDFWSFMEDPTIPINLNWRQYLSSSQNIQTNILNLKLMDIQFDPSTSSIKGVASRPDIVNQYFPFGRFDTTRFIGLNYL